MRFYDTVQTLPHSTRNTFLNSHICKQVEILINGYGNSKHQYEFFFILKNFSTEYLGEQRRDATAPVS